jgi:hypothetical protein
LHADTSRSQTRGQLLLAGTLSVSIITKRS